MSRPDVLTLVRQSLGDLPLVETELARANDDDEANVDTQLPQPVKQLVTADGTYATQSALVGLGGGGGKKTTNTAADPFADRPALRRFLLNGDFFIAAALSSILVKLCTRYVQLKVGASINRQSIDSYRVRRTARRTLSALRPCT